MSRCKIYIACHKPCDVPSDDVYTPIQVGRSKSQYSLDMIGDDTGDNISDKNSTFSEMTAQYWVWKNVHDVDYVGFCHYRRFFNKTFTNASANDLFGDGTDVILATPQYRRRTMQHHWLLYICPEDIAILRFVVHKLYPEYDSLIDNCLLDVKCHPCNMLICSKKMFDGYCEWLFSILFECEKYVRLSPYSIGKRVFGYMAEFLMPLYFMHNDCKIKTFDMIFKGERGDEIRKVRWQDKIVCFFIKCLSRPIYVRPYMYDEAHVKALQNDGIQIDKI